MAVGIGRRQSVTFTGEGVEKLERMAAERNMSVSEIVREAVALEEWRWRTERDDQRIYVGKDRSTAHEVRFVRS